MPKLTKAAPPMEYDAQGNYIDTRIHVVDDERFQNNLHPVGKKKVAGVDIHIQLKNSGVHHTIDINQIDVQGMGIAVFRCPVAGCHAAESRRGACVGRHFEKQHPERHLAGEHWWTHVTVSTYPRQPERRSYSRVQPSKKANSKAQSTQPASMSPAKVSAILGAVDAAAAAPSASTSASTLADSTSSFVQRLSTSASTSSLPPRFTIPAFSPSSASAVPTTKTYAPYTGTYVPFTMEELGSSGQTNHLDPSGRRSDYSSRNTSAGASTYTSPDVVQDADTDIEEYLTTYPDNGHTVGTPYNGFDADHVRAPRAATYDDFTCTPAELLREFQTSLSAVRKAAGWLNDKKAGISKSVAAPRHTKPRRSPSPAISRPLRPARFDPAIFDDDFAAGLLFADSAFDLTPLEDKSESEESILDEIFARVSNDVLANNDGVRSDASTVKDITESGWSVGQVGICGQLLDLFLHLELINPTRDAAWMDTETRGNVAILRTFNWLGYHDGRLQEDASHDQIVESVIGRAWWLIEHHVDSACGWWDIQDMAGGWWRFDLRGGVAFMGREFRPWHN